jgi:3-methyladenine DNA glycosylase AlkC
MGTFAGWSVTSRQFRALFRVRFVDQYLMRESAKYIVRQIVQLRLIAAELCEMLSWLEHQDRKPN